MTTTLTTRAGRSAARRGRGFTILELIVTLLILGIISVIAIVGYTQVISNSKTSAVQTTAQSVARDANAVAASGGGSSTTVANVLTAVSELPGYAVGGTFTGGTYATQGTKGYKLTQNATSYYVCVVSGSAVATSDSTQCT